MDRRIVKLESIPNLSWSPEALYDVGIKYGVEFPNGNRKEDVLLLGKEKILEALYLQCEFEAFQDPVEEVKGQRSYVSPEKNYEGAYVFKVRVIYTGPAPLINLKIEGKNYIFLHGEPYWLDQSKHSVALMLSRRHDFDVRFNEAESEDSLLLTMRQIKREYEESFYADEPDDFEGLF